MNHAPLYAMTNALGEIVWAVNPLDDAGSHAHSLALLGSLWRGLRSRVHPAFVLSPTALRVPPRSFPSVRQAFDLLARKRFDELVHDWGEPAMQPLTILDGNQGSDVEKMNRFAQEQSAEAILVSTHARSGLSRFWLGSFAEDLLLQTERSVFTVNSSTLVRDGFRSLLFPTTFTEPYRKDFERVVKFCKAFDATLTLYYKDPFVDAGLVQSEVQPYLREAAIKLAEDAKAWRDWAEEAGVRVHLQIESGPGYLLPRLVKIASEKNMDLIVMASGSSTFCSGHLARHVIRHSPCPVWAIPVELGKWQHAPPKTGQNIPYSLAKSAN